MSNVREHELDRGYTLALLSFIMQLYSHSPLSVAPKVIQWLVANESYEKKVFTARSPICVLCVYSEELVAVEWMMKLISALKYAAFVYLP